MKTNTRCLVILSLIFVSFYSMPSFAAGGGKDGHEPTCEESAHYRLNWFDLFGWKEANAQELTKCREARKAGEQYQPTITGAPLIGSFINFALLIFLLVRVGRKPIQNFLTARHETIKLELEESRQRWKEAQKRLEDYEDKLQHMEEERVTLIKQYEEQIKREIKRIEGETEKQIQKIHSDTERQIQWTLRRTEKSIRKEVVEAAISTAQSLIQKEMTTEDRNRLQTQFIERVSQKTEKTGGDA